ncbi:MAG: LysE family translocator [Nevskia sp.]|nr:LysE family translocator [Nevskia sp.]
MSGLALAQSPGSLFAAVAAAHALAVMSPGPDLAMVSRQTLAHGRAAGVRTALGIGCGIAFHVAYGLFGVSWAIAQFPALLGALKLVGAALLLWIGAQAIRAQPQDGMTAVATGERAAARDFGVGLATNVLNVKAMLFFVALCSTVIAGNTTTALKLALGAWMIVVTGVWFCLVAVTLGHPRVRAALASSAHWIDRAMGAILLALGSAMLIAALV